MAESCVSVELIRHRTGLESSSAKGENQVKDGTSLNFVVGSCLLVVHLVGIGTKLE